VYEILDCREIDARPNHVKTAVAALRRGRVVVVPGESSYLMVGDAFSQAAVSQIRESKGRSNTQLSVLVGSIGTTDGLATGIPPYARDLMRSLWPGMLTLVLRQQPSLAWPLTTRKIAIRMPLHPMLLSLANEIGPIAVTTANRAGMPPALTASQAESQFDDEIAVYLDAGSAPELGRSSVVDVTGLDPLLVREGETSAEHIRNVCPTLEVPGADA
jgi:L-threonylcarbamoyladenylate synthase